MDILECSIEEKSRTGAVMKIVKPGTDDILTHQAKGDDEPREMFVKLLGPEEAAFKRGIRQARNRESRRKANYTPSNEDVESDRRADCKWLASLTVGGLVFMKGAWVELDSENAFQLYLDVAPVRGQALDFVLDAANFTKG